MMVRYFLLSFIKFLIVYGIEWPVPYERVTNRTTNDPYCQAGLIPFCPNGKTVDSMIYAQNENDTIEIFALKKPVWSFKFGDLMAKFVRIILSFFLSN